MRILPRLNDDINEEWLADKSRFACDGLKRQRLTKPLINQDGAFVPVNWETALQHAAEALRKTNPKDAIAVAGELADVEAIVALKDLFVKVLDCRNFALDSNEYQPDITIRNNYIFNTSIKNVERADAIILIGTNPKTEAPLINSRIRKGFLYNETNIALIGPKIKLNYEYEHLGTSPADIKALTSSSFFKNTFQSAKNPLIIVGSSVFDMKNAKDILDLVKSIASSLGEKMSRSDWQGLSILQRVRTT
jgi:NADH dehydrogenase/NADH:ubiquinone oxidoreductase subunit G